MSYTEILAYFVDLSTDLFGSNAEVLTAKSQFADYLESEELRFWVLKHRSDIGGKIVRFSVGGYLVVKYDIAGDTGITEGVRYTIQKTQ